MDFSRFSALPIVDGHVHFVHPERLEDVLDVMSRAGCARANLVCLPDPDGTAHNAAALFFRDRCPGRAYLSGALAYGPALADFAHAPEILARQVLALKAQGFDGLKLIEGKPSVRKLLPFPLDGPLYAGVWAALEREGLPVLLHIADPGEFWDARRCPEWARQSGWDYTDGTYPSPDALYVEVEHVLVRHPGLKLVMAHFSFLSADLERAARFLDAHPGVCFDLAPHLDMYRDFSRQADIARDFFLRYQDRIIYGTDSDTRVLERGEAGMRWTLYVIWLIRACLECPGEFVVPGGQARAAPRRDVYRGLGLPEQVLIKIYCENLERLYGSAPRS